MTRADRTSELGSRKSVLKAPGSTIITRTPSGANSARNHLQPGDPSRGAAAIITAATSDDPPLRLALGGDSVGRIHAKLDQVREDITAWEELSVSTDFPA